MAEKKLMVSSPNIKTKKLKVIQIESGIDNKENKNWEPNVLKNLVRNKLVRDKNKENNNKHFEVKKEMSRGNELKPFMPERVFT